MSAEFEALRAEQDGYEQGRADERQAVLAWLEEQNRDLMRYEPWDIRWYIAELAEGRHIR